MPEPRELPIFGRHDAKTIQQIEQVASHPKAIGAALMADGHLGYGMPIGGVVAYDNAVSPEGVGFDIGCGNKAVKTDRKFSEWVQDMPLARAIDRIFDEVAFGVGQASNRFKDHPVFDDPRFELPLARKLKDTARQQLGSVGSGNHYVDLLVDESDFLWVGVHFGSRGLGHKLASRFMSDGDMMKPVTILDLGSYEGQDYWEYMGLAGAYAYAGRDCVVDQVLSIIGCTSTYEVHNHHNFAWKEQHEGVGEVVVVRKGATPAFDRQEGFVGGSMGDDAVILQGASGDEAREVQRATFYSTIHGAGRVMSRTEAKGRFNRKTGQVKSAGRITAEMMRTWLERKGVELRGGDLDEAPQAYRRLGDVLEAQGNTVAVTETLRPVAVAMAGKRDWDPYKD
jgi:tRNA-splicing ligase RtcB